MRDRAHFQPDADDHASPAMRTLFTEKELAHRQVARAEAAVSIAETALQAVQTAWQEANEVRCQRQAAWTAYQQAKATQTRIAELKLRCSGALILLVGSLVLATIQVSAQSSLVVLLLFTLPLALYACAKGRQLCGLHPPRQMYLLERECQTWAKRDQHAQAAYLRKSAGYPQLVARHQAALADLTYWRHELQRCQHRLDALYSAEQRAKQAQQHRLPSTPR
jgi:hypothetical protein